MLDDREKPASLQYFVKDALWIIEILTLKLKCGIRKYSFY